MYAVSSLFVSSGKQSRLAIVARTSKASVTGSGVSEVEEVPAVSRIEVRERTGATGNPRSRVAPTRLPRSEDAIN